MSVHYHTGKANVVADGLIQLCMGSMPQIDDEKKELDKELHQISRLGVCLVVIQNRGVSIHSSSESSFVKDVIHKQHLDIILMEFKDSILSKVNESFTQGGGDVLKHCADQILIM